MISGAWQRFAKHREGFSPSSLQPRRLGGGGGGETLLRCLTWTSEQVQPVLVTIDTPAPMDGTSSFVDAAATTRQNLGRAIDRGRPPIVPTFSVDPTNEGPGATAKLSVQCSKACAP